MTGNKIIKMNRKLEISYRFRKEKRKLYMIKKVHLTQTEI